jgi:peptide/nickel transport system permease protein
MPVQYLNWIWGALHGNFGESLIYHRESFTMLLERVPNTLVLAGAALLLQLVIGVPLGVLAAFKRGTWVDGAIRVFGVVGHAVPAFWLGLILIIVFAVQLRWLPSIGVLTVGHDQLDILDRFKHLILPSFVLALTGIANYSRILRTETLDVLSQDFVRTAHAKGLKDRTVVFTHALRNALIPILTVVGLQTGLLLGGAVLTEHIFAWPGVGRLAFEAISNRDTPLVNGAILLFAATFVLVNLFIDVAYAMLNPRIRYA